MSATTIGEVRDKLAQETTAAAFSEGFARVYFGQAMGSLPKSEIDLLVFTLLVGRVRLSLLDLPALHRWPLDCFEAARWSASTT
jgi:hypothetical protein